ncbi:hypothetical protein [Streptomyces sp. NPDC005407]|uniref:hypothetical protein n=1 Tax=Streptomyces sp. NPDC005407 TaxID=3155340 RepID=UPI0033BBBFA1
MTDRHHPTATEATQLTRKAAMPTEQDPPGGQPALNDQAQRFLAAVEEAMATTSFRDDSAVPVIGTAPPVAQPGRPPMSQKATDASALMLSAGAASLPIGAVAVGIMLASGYADPTVIGMICAAPAAVALPILALARLLRRAKDVAEAAPPEHHHHYNGPVIQDQRSIHSQTRGVIAHTRNELPRGESR